jgi:hypothetical protein
MLRRTVELELADFPGARTTIAPPFYAVQMDIAMGFPVTPVVKGRDPPKANALVIVCLLTSASSIHALDSTSTVSVISALERHSSRYGVPAKLYVDSGSQLLKLKDAKFSLHDVHSCDVNGVRFDVIVSTPKAHQAQGRVEAKVKQIRRMLQIMSKSTDESHTLLGWETVFARISDALDDLPIARGGPSAASDLGWDIITPNRLKLGRNNHRQLSGTIQLNNSPQSILEKNRRIQETWYGIFKDRVLLMLPKSDKVSDRPVRIGDVVIFVFDDNRNQELWEWRLGVIERLVSRTTVEIRYVTRPGGERRLINRSVRNLSVVLPSDELPPSSPDFFKTE